MIFARTFIDMGLSLSQDVLEEAPTVKVFPDIAIKVCDVITVLFDENSIEYVKAHPATLVENGPTVVVVAVDVKTYSMVAAAG